MHISVYEYGYLQVGESYNDIVFTEVHYKELAKYLTENKSCGYYSLLYNKIRFANFVGVIKIFDVTIEILPKIEKSDADEKTWRNALIKMLYISLQVESNTTTLANIHVNQQSVLTTYIELFLTQTESLLHKGLIKKYKKKQSNKTALKGKLVFSKHITQNLIHAERFYVEDNEYNQDNVFNFILQAAMECIIKIDPLFHVTHKAKSLLTILPECTPLKISESLFSRLKFDRKTEHYKTAIELARIILLNYHPDVKSGSNSILAIMFDMNLLWENYMYYMLKRAGYEKGIEVSGQQKKLFWHHQDDDWTLKLKPDLVLSKDGINIVIDTKWKYDSQICIQDIRQVYTYGDYFSASKNFLMYPDKLEYNGIVIEEGNFYNTTSNDAYKDKSCSLMYVDIIDDGELNRQIGAVILDSLF